MPGGSARMPGGSTRMSGASTRMAIVSRLASLEPMQPMLEMGAQEGVRQALAQIDGVIAAEARPR